MIAAAYLDLDPSDKLVLLAIADSSDEHTRHSAPGRAKLRAWSGRSDSQVKRIVAQLVELGLVARHAPGRKGRRAVYRVFPAGVPRIPSPDEVAARYSAGEPIGDDDLEGRTDAPLTETDRGASTPAQRRTDAPPSFPSYSPPRASGFPGARPPAEAPDPRSQRGHHNQPCPIHPDEVVPCGRCAHAAANSDPNKIAEARRLARAGVRRATTATTEEDPDAQAQPVPA